MIVAAFSHEFTTPEFGQQPSLAVDVLEPHPLACGPDAVHALPVVRRTIVSGCLMKSTTCNSKQAYL